VTRPTLRYNLERPPALVILSFADALKAMRVNGQLVPQFTIAEHLDGIRSAADKTVLPEAAPE